MPGGFAPFPRRFGASSGRPIEAITNAICSGLGSAFDTRTTSAVWQKAHAAARQVASAWEQNRKLANQNDPARVTDYLARWERILGVRPLYGSSDAQRRAVLAARWALIGKTSNLQQVTDLIRAMLPNTYVGLVHTTSPLSTVTVPITVIGGTGGAPLGTKTMAGTHGVVEPGYWSGSCHHLAIETSKPSWMSEADYYTEVGQLQNGVLRRFLPAWVTFSVFRDGTLPSGFWLDDPYNLDNERLKVVAWGLFAPGGPAFAQSILPVMFSLSATAPTYAMWYGFTLPALTVTTLTITAVTLPSCRGAIFANATEPSDTPTWTFTGGASANFPGPYPAGNYVVEVTANATSTIGTSPGSFTIGLS